MSGISPPAVSEVRVKGLVELNRALRLVDSDVRLGIRKALRSVGEPIRLEAEILANKGIRNIGPNWSQMRVGQTLDTIYVAPKRRGPNRGLSKRANLAGLLMDRAMQPALEHNAHLIEGRLGDVLDRVADNFSR